LGKKWKAESAETKAHWKALAEEIKREHAAKHPNYQYAPRKPSEKKRRSTARRNTETSALTCPVTQGGPPQLSSDSVPSTAATAHGNSASPNQLASTQSNMTDDTRPVLPSPSPEFEQDLRNHTADYVTGNVAGRFLNYHGRRTSPVISVSIPPLISSAEETDSPNTENSESWTDFDFDFEDFFIAGSA
jgi:hypothetical protein